ncbi:MAG: DUF2752 domain-containing protein [Phycisphaerae bacterium]|nr:DUF2752 domain-containing protein [Phycisphaerae bacterium]
MEIKEKKRIGIVFILINLIVAMLAFGLLATAWKVNPNVKGFGTHRQLDMPSCGFLERTGYPCPTCGMTTAFSHTVRLELFQAAKVQPTGMLLALACMAIFPFCLWQGLSGRPVEKVMAWLNFNAVKILWGWAILFLAAWGYKALTVRMFG